MEISMYMTETVIKPIPLIATMPLPPFAAFFVKASSPTELKISSNSTPTKSNKHNPDKLPYE